MPALELFAGVGGLALGVEAALGATTAVVAEVEKGPATALRRRFPDAPNVGDVTTAPWDALKPWGFGVVSSGSPCPDISGLGRRAGMGVGTRSGLWSCTVDAVAALEPEWVVWENVRGALSTRIGPGHPMRALGKVLADLAALGYDAQWRTVKASDVGAPHARARVFVLARHRDAGPTETNHIIPRSAFALLDRAAGRWFNVGGEVDYSSAWPPNGAMVNGYACHADPVPALYPEVPLLRTPVASEAGGGPLSPVAAARRGQTLRLTGLLLDLWHPGLLPESDPDQEPGWREYAPAIQRWEQVLGRPAPEATEPGRNRPRASARLLEWMVGLDEGHVTDPELGLTWKEQVTACGNIAQQQQVAHALNHMKPAQEVRLARAA